MSLMKMVAAMFLVDDDWTGAVAEDGDPALGATDGSGGGAEGAESAGYVERMWRQR